MTNPQGVPTNALYGFIRSIYKIMADFSPDYLVVVFDGPDNKKSRTTLYEAYKSHRPSMPEDLFSQLEKALYFCEIAGIPFLSLPGVEADDTIGSIARFAEANDLSVFICSSDKDLCQLVNAHVKIIHPHKDNLLVDATKVKELFGVLPAQMIDYLALVGDTSDNIPGVPGFGPKTATALLSEYHTLDNLLDHASDLSGKKKETLIENANLALLSRQLATIQLDLDIPKELVFYSIKHPNLSAVQALYEEMRFLSLLKELSAPAQAPLPYTCVKTEEEVDQLLDSLSPKKEICIDTETTDLHPMNARLVGIGLSACEKTAAYIPCNGTIDRADLLKTMKPFLEDQARCWIGHHLKYDMHVFANEGIFLHAPYFDTLIASYLTHPHVQRHNLDELTLVHFNHRKIPIESLIGKGKQQISMIEVPIDRVCAYCGEDVDYTLRLKTRLEEQLKENGLWDLFTQIEMPLVPVLMRMEREGIFVDLHQLQAMSQEIKTELAHLEKQIYKFAKEPFNINSPKQLSHVLFEELELKPPKKTMTGFSTSAEVLESLQDASPIIPLILEYRTLEKMRSTYIDALPEQINPVTGKIHCTFNQSMTATGRLSCHDPNLQNIPVRTPLGKKIRAAFKPRRGHSFLSADYSQIELRLLAHLSDDPMLVQAFCAREDIHAYTAAQVFDVPLSQVTPEMRHQAKAVNFGIIYGQQAFGLSKELGISQKEAADFIDKYFKRYPKIQDFLTFCKEAAKKTGYAVTLTGRRRPIPDIHSKNPLVRAQAERLAVNTPLQGTSADLIKIAMIAVDKLLQKNSNLGSMILQIHDELLFESLDREVDQLSRHVKKIMEDAMSLKVPLVVDISIGKNWSEC